MKNLIIIIDDDPAILLAFKKLLKKKNYDICTFSRWDQAEDELISKSPVLIILDMKIPAAEGIALLKRIKLNFPEIPVVAMTAFSNIFTEKEVLQTGADGYLTKPFEITSMLTNIEKYIQHHYL
ncbi:MAG: response regulator [Calditrichaceae bacterium]